MHDDTTDRFARQTRVAAYALCVTDGRILLCRLAPPLRAAGRWTLPGGGLEFGEQPADGVLRELEEETGLRGRIAAIAGADARLHHLRRDAESIDLFAVRLVYRVEIVGGELRDEADGSTDAAAWFALRELAGLPLIDLVTSALAMGGIDPTDG